VHTKVGRGVMAVLRPCRRADRAGARGGPRRALPSGNGHRCLSFVAHKYFRDATSGC
jgi:hypothetical protein